MGRNTPIATLLVVGGIIAAVSVTVAPWAASSVVAAAPKKAAAPPPAPDGPAKASPEAAEKAYAAGVKAFQGGKPDEAISSLNTAINGGLGAVQMARALYTRGLAYRKKGQTALAIADLSNALWLKTGLTEAEIAQAQEARTAAYADAGSAAPSTPVRADPSVAQAKPAAPPTAPAAQTVQAPRKPAPPQSPAAQAAVPGVQTAVLPRAPSPAPPPPAPPQVAPPQRTVAVPAPVAPAQAATAQSVTGWKTATRQAKPVEPTAGTGAAPAARPVTTNSIAAAPQSDEVVTNRNVPPPQPPIAAKPSGGFFSSLFGDLSLGASEPPPQIATASVDRSTAVSAWSPDANVAPSGTSRAIASAPAPGASTAKAAPPVAKTTAAAKTAAAATPAAAAPAAAEEGKFRLFVAQAKSRQEAIQVAGKLRSQHQRSIGRHQIAIDQEKGDGAAAVYSIKLGPFASANETRNLCVKLRQSGYDCRLLTQ